MTILARPLRIGTSEIALVRDIAFPLACWDGLIEEVALASIRTRPSVTIDSRSVTKPVRGQGCSTVSDGAVTPG